MGKQQNNSDEMIAIDLSDNPIQDKEITTLKKNTINIETGKPFWKTLNFLIEFVIFVISTTGAVCVALDHMEGFFLWLVSNIIALLYFVKNKQYPLAFQQSIFLCTSFLGVYTHFIKV